ncbi:tetratricopeptide repeat protein [Deferribacter autotrophicus]|uniref:Tetratricopeptide repeat protein n=1 Tax=Deferribacter autotrophicus TaxID=500465 RepID=A0A5A8F4M7_9BACT|nr:tetratricopeptide repeat protein [Deferribacter autotrophicus]KAA0258917.1 tetratricopeptide repeat protein [Deferribacter autotrophicus]
MKIIRFLFIFCFVASTVLSFPLKGVKKGDVIDFSKFESSHPKFEQSVKDKKLKLILFWRSDKGLSVKVAKTFVRLCSRKDLDCYSLDLKGAQKEEILKILGKVNNNFFIVNYKGDAILDFGIYTLPVTVFLDKNDKVLNAIGYEGQYFVKVGRYIKYLTGEISKEEYEKFQNVTKIVRKKSILPDINFIKKLIKDGQKDDALQKLESLNKKGINDFEKVKLAEVLILLGKNQEAFELLKPISNKFIDAKFYIGLALYNLDNLDKALDYLVSIEKIYPNKGRLYYLLGKIYKKKGDYEKACGYFEKACDKEFIN